MTITTLNAAKKAFRRRRFNLDSLPSIPSILKACRPVSAALERACGLFLVILSLKNGNVRRRGTLD